MSHVRTTTFHAFVDSNIGNNQFSVDVRAGDGERKKGWA